MTDKRRIVVLISGSGTNLQAIIDACQAPSYPAQVVAVIANKADAYGLQRASAANIPALALPHTNYNSRADYDNALIAAINQYQTDLVVLAGFMRILTPHFVHTFHDKLLNIHPSLLPKYQGLHTHQRALDAGDTEHGVSVHFVTEQLDGGPVVLQAKIPIFDGDSVDDLANRVHEQEHRIYPLVIKWFCQQRLVMRNNSAVLDGNILPAAGYASND